LKGILVVSNNCQPCHVAREKFAPHIQSGEIEVVSMEDNPEKVKEIMEKYNVQIETIPELLIVTDNGEAIALG